MTDVKKNIITLPSRKDIEAEAASWMTVFGRERISDKDRAKFKSWLRQSERHREAFDEMSALWGDLEILKDLTDIGEAVAETSVVRPSFYKRRDVMAIAASLSAVMLGSGAYFLHHNDRTLQAGEFVTQIGEQKTVELVDGSSVILNTGSLIEVGFSKDERGIRLVRGEAFFEVSKDKRRPFVVYAANGAVKAVGTAFTVRVRDGKALEVTVEEGRVALLSMSGPASAGDDFLEQAAQSPVTELTAGQSVVFDKQVEDLELMQSAELNRKLAWRQGILAYAGDPLEDVIDDISRYTDLKIEIVDPALRSLPIGGYFKVGETDALFDSLELTFGITVERVHTGYIRLSSGA
jgi:transmembrane sensor